MKKKKWHVLLTSALIASMTLQTFAASWVQNADLTWSYINDDGSRLKSTWTQDPDGHWYHVDQNGIMQTGWIVDETGNTFFLNPNVGDPQGSMASGWKLIDNIWYFFNVNHNGTFGKMLTGWQWVDGYCYYLGQDGKMLANTITPDGYQVNSDGQWVENGVAVYESGKGYITKQQTPVSQGPIVSGGSHSGGSGGGGGSSGGGGGGGSSSGSHSTTKRYNYKVSCIDVETGNVLAEYDLDGIKGTTLTLDYNIDGYDFYSGNKVVELNVNNSEFILYYKKHVEEKPEEKPETTEYNYTIYYVDMETSKVLDSVSGKGEKDSKIDVEKLKFDGYELSTKNTYSFTLTSDNISKFIYYEKINDEKPETKIYDYTIRYVCDKQILGELTGSAEEGTIIEIPHEEFAGYIILENQETEFTLSKDIIITIEYKKEPEIASPSEPDEQIFEYTIKCIDYDTDDLLMEYNGKGEANTIIYPDYEIEGYIIMDSYEFELTENNLIFEIYYEQDEPIAETVDYIINYIDEDTDEIIDTKEGTGEIGDIILADEIDGYRFTSETEFKLMEDENEFYVSCVKIEMFDYIFNQIDITTNELIDTKIISGELGETFILDPNNFAIDGYELLGDIPDTVRISGVTENNQLKLYYREINDYEPEKEDVNYVIKYIAENNPDKEIFGESTGIGKDGEQIPVYFVPEIALSDGTQWKAIGESPRIFTLDKQNYVNTFYIEYQYVGTIEEEEKEQTPYEIRFVAEDTGATLGISVGYAYPGDKISFRNNFKDYEIKGNSLSHTISETKKENYIEVLCKRTVFPGPEKNPNTNEYDLNDWAINFRDQDDNIIFESVIGSSIMNTDLIIDYPNVIDLGDGYIYRADVSSPYYKEQIGIYDKQIEIRYTRSDTSEQKLETWKQAAYEAENEFYERVPYDYKIVYTERNSWNDIGLYVGIGTKDSYISIPSVNIPGYDIPDNELGGFTLYNPGTIETADYVLAEEGMDKNTYKTEYTIYFKDEEGNDIFDSYVATIGFENPYESVPFIVYYPNEFTDREGVRWKANETSPLNLNIEYLLNGDPHECEIVYHKVSEDTKETCIIKNESQGFNKLSQFFNFTNDANTHTIYLIGENYNPKDMIIGTLISQYDIRNYSCGVMDEFELDGKQYYVTKITYNRAFNPDTCTHDWEVTKEADKACTHSEEEIITCTKCGETHTIIVPGLGHVDKNKDSLCDNCGQRVFSSNLGDEIFVYYDSGSLDLGTYQWKFICIDDDYNGTGKMLYISENDIGSDIYGVHSKEDPEKMYDASYNASFENSDLHAFLNDDILDGLGDITLVAQNFDNGRVSILSKEEYDKYKANAMNNYYFPDGVFITSTNSTDGTKIVLSNGIEIDPKEAYKYPVRPTILLDKPNTDNEIHLENWSVGDVQERTIGGKTYLFRCIDTDYKDKTNSSKNMALFLCESIIPADIVDDPATRNDVETLWFGEDNNYKYSFVNEWLEENSQDELFDIINVNVGVDTSYTGSTSDNKFEQLNGNELKQSDFDVTQTMYSSLFVLSVEEALQYKDYLWKFEDSLENNPETQYSTYCRGYWLRTPETNTDDMIYSVNLLDGKIEPVSVKAFEDNDYSVIGIRPAFAIPQRY